MDLVKTQIFAFTCFLLSFGASGQNEFSLAELEDQKFYDYSKAQEANPDSVIKLGFYDLSEIPKDIQKFKNVHSVNFFLCDNMDLDQELKKLSVFKKLIEIEVYGNNGSDFPNSLLKFSNLKSLTLTGMKITIPNGIGDLTKLESLVFGDPFSGGLKLSTLPESISQLTKLKKLGLWGNLDLILPDSFYGMNQLEGLDLTYIKDYDLSRIFANLTNLKKLDLTGTPHESLEGIESLSKLKEMTLDQTTSLKSFGENFNQLDALEKLIVQLNMDLCNEEEMVKLSELKSLTDLRLLIAKGCDNKLAFPSSGFELLEAIRIQSLSDVNMEELINAMSHLPSLHDLTLSGHRVAPPQNIGKLQHLTSLTLKLLLEYRLPKSLVKIDSLQTLILSSTMVDEDDETLIQLKKQGVSIDKGR